MITTESTRFQTELLCRTMGLDISGDCCFNTLRHWDSLKRVFFNSSAQKNLRSVDAHRHQDYRVVNWLFLHNSGTGT